MNSKRLRLILLGVLGVCVLAFIAIAYLGLSMLSHKSRDMTNLKLQSETLNAQLANLATSKKEIEQYSYFKAVAKTVIPSDKDQAQAVLDIVQLADQSGIAIQSITFPSSTLGTPAAGSSAAGNAETAAPKDLTSQAKPVSGIPGLYGIELTITPQSGEGVPANKQVTYAKMLDFLNRIERNRRTAQITQVNIEPSGDGNDINFSLVVNIFIKP